jgi:putative transposase
MDSLNVQVIPAPAPHVPLAIAKTKALSVAVDREIVVETLRALERERGSMTKAIKRLKFLFESSPQSLSPRLVNALNAVIKKGHGFVSKTQLHAWCNAEDLKPHYHGRIPAPENFTGDLVRLYNLPSKPQMSDVHRKLLQLGHTCSYHQVRTAIKNLPAQFGAKSAARIGSKLYAQAQAPYTERTSENLLPGEIYMADGYKADVYLEDPRNPGKIWRPELMHIIDVKSRALVGYQVMFSESALDIMQGWANAFARHDHVPVWVYVDNGTGYKNKLTQGEVTSYLTRAGVQGVIHSLPYNAKGKGNVERYHRIVRDRFLKFWRPELYCAKDMADDVLKETVRRVNAKEMRLPSIAEFCAAYDDWIEREYHCEPHPEYHGMTRADVWANLQHLPPCGTAVEIGRPAELRVVKRGAVTIYNRRYTDPALTSWNEKSVMVEYDVRREGIVTVRDERGDFICDACLVKKIGYVQDSIQKDMLAKAQAAAEKRAQKKLDEIKQRNGTFIDADFIVESALPALTSEYACLPSPSEDDDEIKLFDF